MTKKHLKRISSPRSWQISRKENKYVMRPFPGAHSKKVSFPLGVLLRDILGYAKTSKEAKFILKNRTVLVDGKKKIEVKAPVGLFDSINLVESKKYFRILIDRKGRLIALPIEKSEAGLKVYKIMGKAKVKGKTQLNLFDGTNLLVDKDQFKVGDTLVLELPKKTIKEHIKFEKGVLAYLMGGKHIGQTGKVEDIMGNKISYKSESGDVVETLKEYAFVIGKDKPAITLDKK